VGESERLLWHLFGAAAAAAPCIVMFDEMQALFTSRRHASGGGSDGASRMSAVLTSTLLACFDRLAQRSPSAPPVLVLGATNAPHALDPDVLHRFGRVCEVATPSPDDVRALVRLWLRRWHASGLLAPSAASDDEGPVGVEAAVQAAAGAITAAHPSVSAAGVVAALQRAVAWVLSRSEEEEGVSDPVVAAMHAVGWRLHSGGVGLEV